MPDPTSTSLFRSRTIYTALGLLSLYWLAAAIIPFEIINTGLNWIAGSIALAVIVSYAATALNAAKMFPSPDRAGQLVLGIVCAWLGVLMSRGWSAIWRATGEPDWMLSSPWLGFFVWVTILAAILHITAPGAIDGRTPRRKWILVGVAMAVGLFCSIVVVAATRHGVVP